MASTLLRAIRQTVVRTVVTATTVGVAVEVTTHIPSQGRASEPYHQLVDSGITPLLRRYCNPELAHSIAIWSAQQGLAPIYRPSAAEQETSLETTVWDLQLSNPIGLAAGFDKNAQAIPGLQNMGFGYLEIGSVTPLPQPGNPKPRMFRLPADGAIINRYGFNSDGMKQVAKNLQDYRTSLVETDASEEEVSRVQRFLQTVTALHKSLFPSHFYTPSTLVGVNLGKNKLSDDEVGDYCQGIRTLGNQADYLVINVSSPNTPGLRDLQAPDALHTLVTACIEERNKLERNKVPLLVKLAPDLTNEELREIADTLLACGGIDGLIVSNTTNQRPVSLLSPIKSEPGGLSGTPLKDRSTECIHILYEHTGGRLPIIGVGGISSASDVLQKLKAGASLVQIYSTLAYQGPGTVTRMRRELAELMRQQGFRAVSDVVGYNHEELYWQRRQVAEGRLTDEPMIRMDLDKEDDYVMVVEEPSVVEEEEQNSSPSIDITTQGEQTAEPVMHEQKL